MAYGVGDGAGVGVGSNGVNLRMPHTNSTPRDRRTAKQIDYSGGRSQTAFSNRASEVAILILYSGLKQGTIGVQ